MDVQTITVVITGISIIIGVILSLNSRKQELETRQAQLFMQVYNRWASKEIIKSYGVVRYKYTDWTNLDELWAQCNPAINADEYSDHMTLHAFYEGLGVLVKKNLIDVSLVEDLFSQRIMWHYERYEKAFKEARVRTGDPTQYDSLEYLYNVMKQRQQANIPA